jgi:hypothetical protein
MRDFEPFGRWVRVDGNVLFDDAVDRPLAPGHSDTVGRVVDEIAATEEFRLVARVDRLAHLERIA